MGLLGIIVKVIGAVLLVLIGLGAYLYFTDYEAKAEVTSTGSEGGDDYIVIRPRLVPYDYKHVLPKDTPNPADFVCVGYGVTYRLQTGHYKVFDEQGDLVYDSVQGLVNLASAAKCASSNTGGGSVLGG